MIWGPFQLVSQNAVMEFLASTDNTGAIVFKFYGEVLHVRITTA